MLLIASGLGHAFPGASSLFCGLDLRVASGTVTAVTGPSGSGKSTLLHILAGWLAPTSGFVERAGVDCIQWVFQNPHGVPRRTAADHVALPLLARGRSRREAHTEALLLLESFGLPQVADTPFSALSGGEAQRLMLARGIAAAPDLLLVDEPTAQLDTITADSVVASLEALAGTGAAVVIATHDLRIRDVCSGHIDLGAYR